MDLVDMEHGVYTQSYSAFVSLVNLHLEARHQESASNEELMIVQKWHEAAAMDKSAYLQCIDEIITERARQ